MTALAGQEYRAARTASLDDPATIRRWVSETAPENRVLAMTAELARTLVFNRPGLDYRESAIWMERELGARLIRGEYDDPIAPEGGGHASALRVLAWATEEQMTEAIAGVRAAGTLPRSAVVKRLKEMGVAAPDSPVSRRTKGRGDRTRLTKAVSVILQATQVLEQVGPDGFSETERSEWTPASTRGRRRPDECSRSRPTSTRTFSG